MGIWQTFNWLTEARLKLNRPVSPLKCPTPENIDRTIKYSIFFFDKNQDGVYAKQKHT